MVSGRIATRIGHRATIGGGLIVGAVGMFLFSRLDIDSTFVSGFLLPSVLASVGIGLCMVTNTAIGTSGVAHEEAGLVSGLLNTSRELGGSVALAALTTLAVSPAERSDDGPLGAVVTGYRHAFLATALLVVVAAVVALLFIPGRTPVAPAHRERVAGAATTGRRRHPPVMANTPYSRMRTTLNKRSADHDGVRAIGATVDRQGPVTEHSHGTQHLTALADPGRLADWRLALCYEAATSAGMLDALPATAAQIASRRRLDAEGVRAVLSVLAAWDLLAVDDAGVFSHGPRRLGPQAQAALAQHGTWVRRWSAVLPHRVHDRRAIAPHEPSRPDLATGLALLEEAGRPYVEPVVTVCLDTPRTKARADEVRILDLGGGHGGYALRFARRGCATTMQDLPGVIAHARADGRLAEAGVELFEGDAFAVLAPGPFDLVLCATVTNMFSLDRVRALLGRLRVVLADDGQVAIATWLRDHGPVGAAFGVQMLVATPDGDAHGEDDYRAVLADTGYTDVDVTEVGDPPLAVIRARR